MTTEELRQLMEEYNKTFRWVTREGERLSVDEMETGHIFNAMRCSITMLRKHGGGEPIWFMKRYRDYAHYARTSPEDLLEKMFFFIYNIEKRGDLPEIYKQPYWEILSKFVKRCSKEQLNALKMLSKAGS